MPAFVTDAEIAALLSEQKPLPLDYRHRIQTKPKRGHRERELDVRGSNGNDFRLVLRESMLNALDFSVILAWVPPRTTALFRLRRYNGRSHEHTNALESQRFYAFHVHSATERYQKFGGREDAYAEPTTRFQDFSSALQCMITECGFKAPPGFQEQIDFGP
ncbi:MAG: hypothetical protein KJ067_23390 [Vicinamibacteria bacterium]|nr:hypothetical protein [Vicinamibacteria bacterium]